ncbi:MAG: lysophospholipid acyltransferase family protein [Christiangramia sp.]
MQGLVFWLIYPILWLVSILPFRIFYLFSDCCYFVIYHLIGYRKKTVTANLKLALPEKSDVEIRQIRKKFYAHMCDMFLEMIKSMSISEKELKRRFTYTNLDFLRRLEEQNKSIIFMCGHYASYEWLISLQLHGLKFRSFGIYKKIRNHYFDQLIRDIRGKFDAKLISMYEATETIQRNETEGFPGNYAMIADQSPKLQRAKYWFHFMGVRVPVFEGSERLAKKLDMNVIYLHVEKKKRGFYEATFKPISENAPAEPPHKITRTFLDLLENQIRENPEYYLWTHKRWKHKDSQPPAHAEIID